jgi:hypothetical protein
MLSSGRSRLPQREPSYRVRLLLAAAIVAGFVWWAYGRPAPKYDLRLLQRCLVNEGFRPVTRDDQRSLSAGGEVVIRLHRNRRVAFAKHDARIRICLDRFAGRHLP